LVASLNITQSKIIDDVVNTRNYNTHFDMSLREKAVEGDELRSLVEILTLLMQAYFLQELGLTESTIIELLKKTGLYRKVANERTFQSVKQL
jgi:hypothetical protein